MKQRKDMQVEQIQNRYVAGGQKQTYEGLADKAREQTSLYQFTDRLYRANSSEEAYTATLDYIANAMNCRRAAILRLDEAGVMRFVAWRGLSEIYRAAVEGHSPWQAGDRDAKPIWISDTWADTSLTDVTDVRAAIVDEGICALAFIPLVAREELLGNFMLCYDEPHIFSSHEMDLAHMVARQLGFSIAKAAADRDARRLVAIVESSDDAILGKDLNGVITSWNAGAERLFGYTAEEAIGKPVTMLIPPDRIQEEETILARIRAGERLDHYETIRQTKKGELRHISLTVSPIKDAAGVVVGASKIARNIGERHRAQEQRELLLREMNHRIKNLFALTSSIVNICARTADTPADLAKDVSGRFYALAQAHSLLLADTGSVVMSGEPSTTMHVLLRTILLPHEGKTTAGEPRLIISGQDLPVGESAVTSIALLLHELATNAAKYGCLSTPEGQLRIDCIEEDQDFVVIWSETGGPPVEQNGNQGFGSHLAVAATTKLGGSLSREWDSSGLVMRLTVKRSTVTGDLPSE